MAEENIPPPIISRPDDVQDLICTLCQEIPFLQEPVVTPCDHIFCEECIETHLTTYGSTYCPNDRKPLQIHQLKPISGISKRLWEKVHVKCGVSNESDEDTLCCSWEGPLEAYKSHVEECSLRNCRDRSSSGEQNLESIRQDLLETQNELAEVEEQLEETEIELSFTIGEINKLKELVVEKGARIDELKEEKSEVERKLQKSERKLQKSERKLQKSEKKLRKTREVSFDRSYKYDRCRVVELTQLICKYLECKPDDIDSGRIFNNVKAMHTDLKKNYSDNPEHYHMDMKMLLATCNASTWFSGKQRTHIISWLNDM